GWVSASPRTSRTTTSTTATTARNGTKAPPRPKAPLLFRARAKRTEPTMPMSRWARVRTAHHFVSWSAATTTTQTAATSSGRARGRPASSATRQPPALAGHAQRGVGQGAQPRLRDRVAAPLADAVGHVLDLDQRTVDLVDG